jgi:hypothetical protein
MKTFFDYASNAACPQRPAWEISPVGYKWAQVVFHNYRQHHIYNTVRRAESALKLKKIGENILLTLTRAAAVSRMHTVKLFSAGLQDSL